MALETLKLIDAWRNDAQIRGITSFSQYRYYRTLLKWSQWLDDRGLAFEDVDRNVIRDYVAQLKDGRAVSYVGFHMAVLSSFYEFLMFEDLVETNPVPPIRKRYLAPYKTDGSKHSHQLVSIEQAAVLVQSIVDIRDRAALLLLFKTGIRKGELLSLDVQDVNLEAREILLKPTAKRSNRLIYFDEEAGRLLARWLVVREGRSNNGTAALWTTRQGRMSVASLDRSIRKAAVAVGLHDLNSGNLEDHFSPHACRHWFTTHLLRAGMPREYVKELRGDSRHEAIDIYHHIDKKSAQGELPGVYPAAGDLAVR